LFIPPFHCFQGLTYILRSSIYYNPTYLWKYNFWCSYSDHSKSNTSYLFPQRVQQHNNTISKSNSQLQTTTISYAFSPAMNKMNKSLHVSLIITCSGNDSLFHSCCARRMFPHIPPFINLNKWKLEGTKSELYRECVLHILPTDMGPDVIMLQERGCLLLWPDSGSLSLQLSQCHDVAVRINGSRNHGFQEIHKDHPIPIPKDRAHHFTH